MYRHNSKLTEMNLLLDNLLYAKVINSFISDCLKNYVAEINSGLFAHGNIRSQVIYSMYLKLL